MVTIPEGECGVFEREGALEIKSPGFYKVSAEYRIRETIPLSVARALRSKESSLSLPSLIFPLVVFGLRP